MTTGRGLAVAADVAVAACLLALLFLNWWPR